MRGISTTQASSHVFPAARTVLPVTQPLLLSVLSAKLQLLICSTQHALPLALALTLRTLLLELVWPVTSLIFTAKTALFRLTTALHVTRHLHLDYSSTTNAFPLAQPTPQSALMETALIVTPTASTALEAPTTAPNVPTT